ncbi:MAG: hypothetical protein IKB34_02075, partial [Clostridia bacterium]|nr:hypothetical protein [Clostridia bacterium]
KVTLKGEIRRFSGGFPHFQEKNIKFPLNFYSVLSCDFCSALNETAPLYLFAGSGNLGRATCLTAGRSPSFFV